MENSRTTPPLPDAETFSRVWRRVMPEPDFSPLRLCSPEGTSTPSADEQPSLTALLDGLYKSISTCRRQARRGGPAARSLAALSTCQRQSFLQLSALCYLQTGKKFCPSPTVEKLCPLPEFLRQEYLLCRHLEKLSAALEQQETDPCFQNIFHRVQSEFRDQVPILCSLLEQFLTRS